MLVVIKQTQMSKKIKNGLEHEERDKLRDLTRGLLYAILPALREIRWNTSMMELQEFQALQECNQLLMFLEGEDAKVDKS